MPKVLSRIAALAMGLVLVIAEMASAVELDVSYQRPPKAVTDILDAPPTPLVLLSPTRDSLLLIERRGVFHKAGMNADMIR